MKKTFAGYAFEWFGDRVQDVIDDKIDQTTKRIADDVADDARHLCPVKTGALKSSIKTVKSKYEGYLVVAGGGNEYYATFTELGTSRQKMQPFLRPALNKNKAKVESKAREVF